MEKNYLYLDFPETGGNSYYQPILRCKYYDFVKTSKTDQISKNSFNGNAVT